MDKSARATRKAEDYETMTHVEHVLRVPDTYIGSSQATALERFVYVPDANDAYHMERRHVRTCEGIERLFLEILSNSVDNIIATRHLSDSVESKKTLLSSKVPLVTVNVNATTVTIRNSGEPIPIAPHPSSTPDKLVLVPLLIFGQLLSSSNYNTDVARVGAGRNGYGAKLTNIYSKRFSVKIGDPERGQEFEATWINNMSKIESVSSTPGFSYDPTSKIWVSKAKDTAKRGKSKSFSSPAYVEVSYEVDFERFSLTENTPDLIGVFSRFVFDYSFTTKILIMFNNKLMDARNPRSFAAEYFPPVEDDEAESGDLKQKNSPSDRAVVWYAWGTKKDADAAAPYVGKDAVSKALISGALTAMPMVEMIVLDTPDAASSLGFVNGLVVPDGVHVAEALSKVCAAIVAASPVATSTAKTGIAVITSADVRSHVSIILNCHLPDPRFTSQTKQVLAAPRPRIEISPEVFKSAMTSSSKAVRWMVGVRLSEAADMKSRRAASKTDGKKRKRVNVESASDANFAGTSRSSECTLWLTEGDSAAAYTAKRIDMLTGRKDYHGIYGLRGKFINVSAASPAMLLKNKEYVELKTLLGLGEGYDYSSKQEAEKNLRYGKICIATDADDDGSSIRALLLNCLSSKWPSLIKAGCIAYLATPAIRITHPKTGAVVERFYSDAAFYAWEKLNHESIRGLRIRHIKGLASSKDNDIKDDLTTAPTVHIVYDDSAKENLDLAFSSKRSDDRKKWIEDWRVQTTSGIADSDDVVLEPLSRAAAAAVIAASSKKKGSSSSTVGKLPSVNRTVSAIINRDLAEYSFSSLFRAISSCADGLKRSQRQALWHCLNFWNFGVGTGGDKDSVKVARLASAVSEAASYAHGEASMQGTLVTMAQNFTGSNNLPVLYPDGQFGAREGGPSVHAAPRYIYTKTHWCVPYIFSKEALSLIPRRRVEGELVESEWIPCDISLSACNGARGIATGWASFIPGHRPSSVVRWTLHRIKHDGKSTQKPLDPTVWYNGFRGTLEVVEKKTTSSKKIVVVDDDHSEEEETAGRSLISQGCFKSLRNATRDDPTYDVEVTELPIGGLWIKPYSKWLESLIDSGRLGDMSNYSTTEVPHFVLKRFSTVENVIETSKKVANSSVAEKTLTAALAKKESRANYPPPPLTLESLKLSKSQAINNMVLINEHGTPSRYKTVGDILEAHFLRMKALYVKIKESRIATAESEIQTLQARYDLLHAIVTGTLVVFRRPEASIVADIKRLKLSEELYEKLKMKDATAEKIAEIEKKIAETGVSLKAIKIKPSALIWEERLTLFEKKLNEVGL
jgi:DNA topoisomerase-2